MQNEQFPSQPKRLRSEAKSFADNSSNTSFVEESVDGGPANKRETIDNLISTLQRLRDDDNSLGPSTMDLLNSMARGYSVQSSSASTSDLSNHPPVETRVPALQAVPYIVPQQKLDLPSWRDGSLHGLSVPYLIHQRQLCSSFTATPQLDFAATAGSLSSITPFSMYQMQNSTLSGEKSTSSQELYGVGAETDTVNARMQYLAQQKHQILQKTKAAYSNQATASQLSMVASSCLPVSTANFPTAQLFTAPAVTRARKAEFASPAEQAAIRKVAQYSHQNRNTQTTPFSSPMLISKAQLLNNQHVEPLYDEKTENNTLRCLLAQPTTQNNEKRQADPIVVDSSVRECNEWSIYTVSLPTRLHVKCNCFGPNT